MHGELAKAGVNVGRKRVARLMRRRLWRYRKVQSTSCNGNCWDSDYRVVPRTSPRVPLRIPRSAVFESIEVSCHSPP